MLVGNGCVDDQINFNTNIMYQYYHAVVDETFVFNSLRRNTIIFSQMQNVTQQCCNGTMDCDYYTISQGNDTCGDLVSLYKCIDLKKT